MVTPFIPKENLNLPDNYGIKIYYVNGKYDEFELASHLLNKETGIFDFWTKEDRYNWVPISSVQRIEFDKRFSKMIAEKNKKLREKKNKNE